MGELILTHSARAVQNPRRLDTLRLFIIPVCLHVGSIYKFLHATPEKFENGVFTLKTHQMFSVHNTPEKFQNATITGHFEFEFDVKFHDYRNFIVSKRSVFRVFSVHTKTQCRCFQIFPV